MSNENVERYFNEGLMSEGKLGDYVTYKAYAALEANYAGLKKASEKNFNEALRLACKTANLQAENARLRAVVDDARHFSELVGDRWRMPPDVAAIVWEIKGELDEAIEALDPD